MHRNMRLGCNFSYSRRRETEFIRAEDVMHGDQQPLVLAWLKCRGDGAEIGRAAGRRGIENANTRIATTQGPPELFLIGIHCLNGVPPWRPKKRNESGGRLFGGAFHRIRKR